MNFLKNLFKRKPKPPVVYLGYFEWKRVSEDRLDRWCDNICWLMLFVVLAGCFTNCWDEDSFMITNFLRVWRTSYQWIYGGTNYPFARIDLNPNFHSTIGPNWVYHPPKELIDWYFTVPCWERRFYHIPVILPPKIITYKFW